MKRLFLVTVETENTKKEWDYPPKTKIDIPVMSTDRVRAENKVRKEYWGSEYPEYTITNVKECDSFLFLPILE